VPLITLLGVWLSLSILSAATSRGASSFRLLVKLLALACCLTVSCFVDGVVDYCDNRKRSLLLLRVSKARNAETRSFSAVKKSHHHRSNKTNSDVSVCSSFLSFLNMPPANYHPLWLAPSERKDLCDTFKIILCDNNQSYF
jgi:hypothetical protein